MREKHLIISNDNKYSDSIYCQYLFSHLYELFLVCIPQNHKQWSLVNYTALAGPSFDLCIVIFFLMLLDFMDVDWFILPAHYTGAAVTGWSRAPFVHQTECLCPVH